MAVNGQIKVELVQGQAYNYSIVFDDTSAQFVDKVFISSSKLGFCHELVRDNANLSKWTYLFTAEETKGFCQMITTHTVTIHSTLAELDPQMLIDQPFVVLQDKNPQTCEV